jgi:predicted nucleic acid-binding protein
VRTVYLDSSSLVKRYISEPGSDTLDAVYREAERGRIKIAFSIWNIGETIGVIDRKERLGKIGHQESTNVIIDLIGETRKMSMMNNLQMYPVSMEVLWRSWLLSIKHHIYVADAVQIQTAKEAKAEYLLTFDKDLMDVAEKEDFITIYQ